jgi:hypothetical protein
MDVSSITSVIQLAVAPVFLLAAVGAFIGALVNRLARVVDRVRVLSQNSKSEALSEQEQQELAILAKRMKLINLAMGLYTFSALMVCCVIGALFLFNFAHITATAFIAGLFVVAMLSLILGLLLFQGEIYLAIKTVKVMQL